MNKTLKKVRNFSVLFFKAYPEFCVVVGIISFLFIAYNVNHAWIIWILTEGVKDGTIANRTAVVADIEMLSIAFILLEVLAVILFWVLYIVIRYVLPDIALRIKTMWELS